MKNVYLIPGFLASNLAVFPNGPLLWWDPNIVTFLGLGKLRLAANGRDPGPPDGAQMGVALPPQDPWPNIRDILRSQLDLGTWSVEIGPYDWRLSHLHHASVLAQNIRDHSTAAQPATIVGHSAGGLIACLAWEILKSTGDENRVRRIISICSPFQGSYMPLNFLSGLDPSMQELLIIGGVVSSFANLSIFWTLRFITTVALTWTSLYELFPALGGSEAVNDPNRALLYDAANYGGFYMPSQRWLTDAKDVFQPHMASANTHPPTWVMTCVVSTGLYTSYNLASSATPINLGLLGQNRDGDGIVTVGSQTRSGARMIQVTGSHQSVPMWAAQNGDLASWILDPRGPVTPPAPPMVVTTPIPVNMTAPPESDYLSGLQCITGG